MQKQRTTLRHFVKQCVHVLIPSNYVCIVRDFATPDIDAGISTCSFFFCFAARELQLDFVQLFLQGAKNIWFFLPVLLVVLLDAM